MICLCCGKPIKDPQKANNGWHHTCIKRFFGTKELPELNLSADTIESIANECTRRGFTVPGVQKKLSLHLSNEKNDKVRLTLVGYPAGYILKPQTADYPALPEAEYLVMQMAKMTGIKTVPFALIRLAETGEFAYITKRIDRTASGEKIAMEDFCQLDLRVTADKYKGSYEQIAKLIQKYSSTPKLDLINFWEQVIFSWVTGNADMHLKNFSLYSQSKGNYVLTPAYDMLSTVLVMPEDTEELALTLNGKKSKIKKKDFIIAITASGIEDKIIDNLFKKFAKAEQSWSDFIRQSLLPETMQKQYINVINSKLGIIK